MRYIIYGLFSRPELLIGCRQRLFTTVQTWARNASKRKTQGKLGPSRNLFICQTPELTSYFNSTWSNRDFFIIAITRDRAFVLYTKISIAISSVGAALCCFSDRFSFSFLFFVCYYCATARDEGRRPNSPGLHGCSFRYTLVS